MGAVFHQFAVQEFEPQGTGRFPSFGELSVVVCASGNSLTQVATVVFCSADVACDAEIVLAGLASRRAVVLRVVAAAQVQSCELGIHHLL